jgi:UDP:flavonoid glycosyltransferase YjiC (YdhE family)
MVRMKVFIHALGSQGDVAPVLPLSVALRSAGDDVTVCASPNFADFFSGHGLKFQPLGPDTRRMLSDRRHEFRSASTSLFATLRAVRESVNYFFPALLPLARGADIYLGAGIEFCGRSIAEHLRIPYRYVATIPQLLRSRFHPPMTVPFQPESGSVNNLLWDVNDFTVDHLLGLKRVYNAHRARLGLGPVRSVLSYMTGRTILAADAALAAVPPDTMAVQVGYFHPVESGALSPELSRFIEDGPPPVFIGFGSMPDVRPERKTAAVQAVVDSGRFRVGLSRGWADRRLDRAGDRVCVVGFVPYLALFPRLALAVHHGGSGTTHCAARAGVPQLIIPHMLDQFYWANRVRRLGIGPGPLSRSRLTGTRLLSAIDHAVANPGFRERAGAMGASIRKTDPLAAAVSYVVELASTR